MSVLRALAVVLMVSLLLLTGGAGWLAATPSGARWLARQADVRLDTVQLGAVDGTLVGELHVRDVRWSAGKDGPHVRMDRVDLQLATAALLRGSVRLRHVRAEDVRVSLPREPAEEPAAPSAAPFSPAIPAPPVDLVVDALEVAHVLVERDGAAALRIDRGMLAARWTREGVEIRRLELRGPAGEAWLEGRGVGSDPIGLDARGAIAWQIGPTRYAAQLEVATRGQRTHLGVTLHAPFAAHLEAEVRQVPGLPWEASLGVPALDVRKTGLALGPLERLGAELHAEGSSRRATLSGELALDGRRVRIETLALDLPSATDGAALHVRTRMRVDGGAASATPVEIELRAAGSSRRVDIESLRVRQASGQLEASAALELEPQLDWEAQARATGFDPGELVPGWRGSLDLALRSRGQQQPDGLRASVTLERLAGALRGQPVSGGGQLELAQGVVSGELQLRSGSSRLEVRGRRGDTMQMAGSFDLRALSEWLPGVQGDARGRFDVTGRWPALAIAGSARLRELDWMEVHADELALHTAIDDLSEPSGSVRVDAQGVSVRGTPLGPLAARLSGSPARHVASLEIGDGPLQLRARAAGTRAAALWTGTLDALDVQLPGTPKLALAAQTRVVHSEAEGLRLEPACLRGREVEICASATRTPGGVLEASYRLVRIPFAPLRVFRPHPVLDELEGELSAVGEIRATPDGDWEGELELRSPAAYTAGDSALGRVVGTERVLLYEDLALHGTLTGRRAEVHVSTRLMQGGSLEARLVASQLGTPSAPLTGRIQARATSLQPLEGILRDLGSPTGQLSADLEVAGTLAAPILSGELRLAEFAGQIAPLGIRLENGSLHARPSARGDLALALAGRVSSGGGALELDGTWSPTRGLALDVTGERFLAADLPGARVWMTPRLQLEQDSAGLRLAGSARLPRARIDLGKLPQATPQRISSDVVVVDREPTSAPEPPLALTARVSIELGDDVKLRGFGLDVSLTGQLIVHETPDRPTTASGEVEVNGNYSAYGQELHIERGLLLFAGTPIDDPRVQLTAVRQVEDVTAGLRITGTARQPRVEVFSIPPMAEADALAHLVTGKPLAMLAATGEEEQTAALASAARALGAVAGSSLAATLGSRLGIHEVSIERSDVLGGEALMLGQYLSPRLYLRYGFGLFEPGDLVALHYRLSDALSVRVVHGPDELRAGLEIRIER